MDANYSLECEDDFGFQAVKDRADLLEWLDNWMYDPDSSSCKLIKTTEFNADQYADQS
jgi:hypothetical protein